MIIATVLILILFHRYRIVLLTTKRHLAKSNQTANSSILHITSIVLTPWQICIDLFILAFTLFGAITLAIVHTRLQTFFEVLLSVYNKEWRNDQIEAFNIFNKTEEL